MSKMGHWTPTLIQLSRAPDALSIACSPADAVQNQSFPFVFVSFVTFLFPFRVLARTSGGTSIRVSGLRRCVPCYTCDVS